ncbi:protein FAM204A isoform X2 [Pseudoliparis swirei]|uniref:protein FAM204A isoform X2 n=1 Tax=Pseudoliparis swirei TaxID=2059687 RepID=UPI0024BDB466|nr:protein FAM204A isoform X2 [Pseudoliparis swirei]
MYSGLLPTGSTEDDLSPDEEKDAAEEEEEEEGEKRAGSAAGAAPAPAEEAAPAAGEADRDAPALPGVSRDMWQKFQDLRKKNDEMKTTKGPGRRTKRRPHKKGTGREEPTGTRAPCRRVCARIERSNNKVLFTFRPAAPTRRPLLLCEYGGADGRKEADCRGSTLTGVKQLQRHRKERLEEREKHWADLKQHFGANDRFLPPACSKPPPKSGLEARMEAAVAEGDIAKAEEMSDRLATRELAVKISQAADCRDFVQRKQEEEEERAAQKRKNQIPWGFEAKRRWETKSNMGFM